LEKHEFQGLILTVDSDAVLELDGDGKWTWCPGTDPETAVGGRRIYLDGEYFELIEARSVVDPGPEIIGNNTGKKSKFNLYLRRIDHNTLDSSESEIDQMDIDKMDIDKMDLDSRRLELRTQREDFERSKTEHQLSVREREADIKRLEEDTRRQRRLEDQELLRRNAECMISIVKVARGTDSKNCLAIETHTIETKLDEIIKNLVTSTQ